MWALDFFSWGIMEFLTRQESCLFTFYVSYPQVNVLLLVFLRLIVDCSWPIGYSGILVDSRYSYSLPDCQLLCLLLSAVYFYVCCDFVCGFLPKTFRRLFSLVGTCGFWNYMVCLLLSSYGFDFAPKTGACVSRVIVLFLNLLQFLFIHFILVRNDIV